MDDGLEAIIWIVIGVTAVLGLVRAVGTFTVVPAKPTPATAAAPAVQIVVSGPHHETAPTCRGTCTECGAQFEFDSEHTGKQAACPYCLKQTDLFPAIRKATPAAAKETKQEASTPTASVLSVILLVLAVAIFAGFCISGVTKQSKALETVGARQTAPLSNLEGAENASSGQTASLIHLTNGDVITAPESAIVEAKPDEKQTAAEDAAQEQAAHAAALAKYEEIKKAEGLPVLPR